MLALLLQRSTPLFGTDVWHTALVIIAIIIGGGLLVWAVRTAIDNFVGDPWKQKVTAVLYIVVALFLAFVVLHWAGLV